jgi:molecular chaperone GrpE (heat shock protein)
VSENALENDQVVASEDVTTEAVDERSEAERQRDEYLDALQRLQADFENYRKRMARSSEDAAVRAVGDIVAKLLPVIDAFDLAQAHFSNAESDEAAALTQSRGLLLDALAREGLPGCTTRSPTSRAAKVNRLSMKCCALATSGRVRSCARRW